MSHPPATQPGISVVVPCYCSGTTLPELVQKVAGVLSGESVPFEIVLVNDGSRDGTWTVIQDLIASHDCVRGIDLLRNFGQHNALLAGIRAARYSLLVTIDDDLQNPPEEIPKLVAALSDDVDVVYGTPARQQHGVLRNAASWITKLVLQSSMGAETARSISAFRVFRTQIREAFASFDGPYVSIDVLLTWGTTRFRAVTVRHEPRLVGESHYSVGKLLVHALNLVTGFSTAPLRIASLVGFGLTLFGILLLAFVVIRFIIEGGVVPGFALLASSLAIFSGAELFCLGIMGEYLARMHFRTMDKPSYAVRTDSGSAADRNGAS